MCRAWVLLRTRTEVTMDPKQNDIEQNDSPRRDPDDAEEFVPGPQDPASEADDSDEAIDDLDDDDQGIDDDANENM
jgi:hypothetical protein